MNQSELENLLMPLKKDLTERINFRGILQSIINKHFFLINDCMNKGISLNLIHSIIFPNNDVSYNHLRNLFYRARNKLNKNTIKSTLIKEEINQGIKRENNVFNTLVKKEKTPIHNSNSDQESADERLKKLLIQKKNEA